MPIDDHHLPVEIGKGAEAEVAMALKLADRDDALRDAFDQRTRGGYLKQGSMGNFQMIGERTHDDVIEGLVGRAHPRLQGVHQRLRDFTT
jgi:hypothetical protein